MSAASFKHSGDLGDIIYSLPAVRALGGGVLYLDVNGGESDPIVQQQTVRGRCKFNQAGYDFIRPLLMEQPYLQDVRIWSGEPIQYNLDSSRLHMGDVRTNLAVFYMRAFGLDETVVHQSWLSLKSSPISLPKPIIVNRTVRYQSKYHWWELNIRPLLAQAVFMGLEKEHEIFEYTFDCKIDFHKGADALEIARILAGSQLLIANQSFIMSIAIGLGTAFAQEVYDSAPNCIFQRANAQYF
ncbi:MAG: hypothetical protein M3O30_11890 [Planctomycetota bacterium]|nr:hypothetical protein [Planctomycetota bacterium]